MRTYRDNHEPTYDPQTHTYCLHHDWESDATVTMTVARGIAAITNTPLMELSPLYDEIDPDALNHLFFPDSETADPRRGRVTFTVNACEVTVSADGRIEIQPFDES